MKMMDSLMETKMHRVLIAGAGKIGSLIACMLIDTGDFDVHLMDLNFKNADVTRLLKRFPQIHQIILDVNDPLLIAQYLKDHQIQSVISSLPYFLNTNMAKAAREGNAHYFDLTEDTAVSETVQQIALNASTAFVPQCGLAPGFISIVAHSLMQQFESCFQAKLRVGALPQCTSNALHYSLTWSTDGLINEYGNPCFGIQEGKPATFTPLEGLEAIEIQGIPYEAFHTSGGIGHLADLYKGKIQRLDYKTIRYPGHCEKMRFLMETLKLNQDRETLKRILERAMPKTYQDMVIIYVSVEGTIQEEFLEKSYTKKVLPKKISGLEWSAIQVCTAASVCAVMDLVLSRPTHYKGFILQETFSLDEFLNNRFGKYYVI